jgi:hypothetical protein
MVLTSIGMGVDSTVPRSHSQRRQCPGRGPIRPLPASALLLVWGAIGSAGAADMPAAPPSASHAIGSGAVPALAGPSLATPALVLHRGFHLGDGAEAARAGLSIHVAPAVGLAAAAATPVHYGANLSDELIGFMVREALRYRRQNALPAFDANEEADSFLAEERSRQAGRIFTRSFKRTARLQLERALRSSDAFGRLLDRSWDFGGRGVAAPAGAGRGPEGPGAPGRDAGRAPRGGLASSLRFRLDAHPRLILDTEFLGGRGRIELPLREEPVRLSFERPVGARGRAILSAGLRPGGPDSTSLTFSFSF